MEAMDNKKTHFRMSEDISHISIVESSIEENMVEAKSQSQSLLLDMTQNPNSEKENNSEKMDIVVEGYSEDLITPSPLPLRSVLDDLEKGAELPKMSSQQSVISITDKLLQEAQKATREKQSSSFETNSDIDEQENEDSAQDEGDILENDDSIRNYVDDLGNEDSNDTNNEDNEENDKEDITERSKDKASEDIENSPTPESPEADSELLEVENSDANSNAMDVNQSNEIENEVTEKDDTNEDTMSLHNQLPFSKIRKIIKADAENNLIVTKEAIYVASIAAELFIANITQQTAKITHASKKKTVNIAHLKAALAGNENFDFLEGCFQDIY